MKKLLQIIFFAWSTTIYSQSQLSNHKLDYYLNDSKAKLPKEVTVKLVVNNDTIKVERKDRVLKIPHFLSEAILLIEVDNTQIAANINSEFLENNIEMKLVKYTDLGNRPKSRDGKIEIKHNTFMEIKEPEKIEKIFMLLLVQKVEWKADNKFKRREFGFTRYIYK